MPEAADTWHRQNLEKTIPNGEAPQRPGALRAASGSLASTPEFGQILDRLVKHRLTRPQLQKPASLETSRDYDRDTGLTLETAPIQPGEPVPTPRQLTLWKAVQHAKLQGVSLRGIAKQLGISRNTVRKYVDLSAPPINRTPGRSSISATHNYANGHFP